MNLSRFFNAIVLFFSFSILVAQEAPPPNNTYLTATILTVQPSSCSTQTPGDLTHATNSNDTDYSSSCIDNLYVVKFAYADVWFKATVPSSGKLTIETSAVSRSALSDTVLVAYTLSEGSLTEIGCNDDEDDSTFFSKIELTGQVANTEIYVMVVEYNNQAGYDDGSGTNLGPFNICAFDPDGTLDLPQTQKPLLSYYSNPVGNRLAVESPYEIQTLRVFDLMGKEVLRKTPKQQKLTLNTHTLAPGAYLLGVKTTEGQQTVKLIKK
ncbi:MAG: T9SS type A sorting domain-containing protein [Flavobacteriaceae bacterium]